MKLGSHHQPLKLFFKEMSMRFKHIAVTLGLTVVFLFCTGFQGCGNSNSNGNSNSVNSNQTATSKAVDKFAKSSRELSHDVYLGEKAVQLLYRSHKLDLATKDKYANLFLTLSTNGEKFNNLVIDLSNRERQGAAPANTIQLLTDAFALVWSAYQEIQRLNQSSPPEAQGDLTKGTASLSQHVTDINKMLGSVK
jgi:hypothetical protein